MSRAGEHPLKWTKYLMLAQYGFVTLADLERDIRRYSRADEQMLVRDLRADFLYVEIDICFLLWVVGLLLLLVGLVFES